MPLLQPYEELLGEELLGEELLGEELLGEELLGEELLGKAYRPGMEESKRTETETALGPPGKTLLVSGGQAHGPMAEPVSHVRESCAKPPDRVHRDRIGDSIPLRIRYGLVVAWPRRPRRR